MVYCRENGNLCQDSCLILILLIVYIKEPIPIPMGAGCYLMTASGSEPFLMGDTHPGEGWRGDTQVSGHNWWSICQSPRDPPTAYPLVLGTWKEGELRSRKLRGQREEGGGSSTGSRRDWDFFATSTQLGRWDSSAWPSAVRMNVMWAPFKPQFSLVCIQAEQIHNEVA